MVFSCEVKFACGDSTLCYTSTCVVFVVLWERACMMIAPSCLLTTRMAQLTRHSCTLVLV